MEEGKVSPDWLIFAFPIFLFGRKRGGSSWGYSWAGAGCGLGVGCGLEEKWPGRMCNRLPQARRTPLLPDLSVLLHSWQPRLGFPLGGSALQLVWWLLKQNHHNTCQLCFLHALWQIFFFFSVSCFITVCQTGEPLKFFTDLTFIRAWRSWGVGSRVDATIKIFYSAPSELTPLCLCLKRFLTWCFYTWPAFQMREWHLLS